MTMPSIQVTRVRRYGIGRASEVLGIESWRLKAWAAKGYVPHDRTKGGHLRFSINDLQEIKKAMEFDARPE